MVEGKVTFDVECSVGSPLSHAYVELFTLHRDVVSIGFGLSHFPLDPKPSSQLEEPND